MPLLPPELPPALLSFCFDEPAFTSAASAGVPAVLDVPIVLDTSVIADFFNAKGCTAWGLANAISRCVAATAIPAGLK